MRRTDDGRNGPGERRVWMESKMPNERNCDPFHTYVTYEPRDIIWTRKPRSENREYGMEDEMGHTANQAFAAEQRK